MARNAFPVYVALRVVQVKRQLENLDAIRVVAVVKDTTLANGAATWTVTFDTEVGDLPMLEITSGRLTGAEKK